MAESPYERARRISGSKFLNQHTGKYEHRDENWMPPENTIECEGCGNYHSPDKIQKVTDVITDSNGTYKGVYSMNLCPQCRSYN